MIGIVSLVLCWLPVIGLCIGGLGVLLAIVSFLSRESAGYAIAGMFLSALGALPSAFVVFALAVHNPDGRRDLPPPTRPRAVGFPAR